MTSSSPDAPNVRRSPVGLDPDPSRVLGQLFVPGHALAGRTQKDAASSTVAHVLGAERRRGRRRPRRDRRARFGERHRDLSAMFDRHAARLANRLPAGVELSDQRRSAARRDVHAGVRRWRRPRCATRVRYRQQTRTDSRRVSCGPCSASARSARVIALRSASARSWSGATATSRSIHRGPYATAGTIEDVELDAELFTGLATDVDTEVDPVGPRPTRTAVHDASS